MNIELNAYALALKNALTAIEAGDPETASNLIGMVIDDIEDALDGMEADEIRKIDAALDEARPSKNDTALYH
jgi:hypothetical protein